MELRLESVSFDYPAGPRALDAVDLVVRGGETVAVIGANGSGKTTLLRHLNGLLRPAAGRVLLDGADGSSMTVARMAMCVGLAFQDPDAQIFAARVSEEVGFGARNAGASGRHLEAIVAQALDDVGLRGSLDTHPGDLGTSARKLLTIAAVLAMRTPIVALDEPTVGLDASAMARIETLIRSLAAEGRSVLAVSHDLRFVAETFSRVVLLDGGRVALDGPPEDVFDEAAWPRLRASGLEPPPAARLGARLGLGSTPTDAALLVAWQRTSGV